MSSYLLTAIGLVLVLEGALYALFPQAMQRMMQEIIAYAPDALRRLGLAAAFVGFAIIYFLHHH